MNYYERHIGDYLKDTAHLSLLEHGVYTRLLDVYYTREGAVPAKDVARLVGARSKDEREALAVVLAEFFELRDDGAHHQKRADAEIERFRSKSDKARASINKRWEKARAVEETNNEGNTNVSAGGYERITDDIHRAPVPSNQTPVTKPQTPNPKAARIGINTIGVSADAEAARPEIPPPDPSKSPTRRGAVAVILRSGGVSDATQAHPTVVDWAQRGVTDQQLRDAIEIARTRKPSGDIPVAYLKPIVTELHERPVDAGGSKERDWDFIFGLKERTA